MKKLIVLGIMLLGVVAMAEKLNTDGKDHLKELLGKWGYPDTVSIVVKNNKAYYIDEWEEVNPITKLNSYTFVINWKDDGSKSCIAFDTKQKQLAFLKKCGSDEVQQYIPKKYPNDGKLRG